MPTLLSQTLPPPARILVAEDTGIHSELAQYLLEAEGYRVDVVTDGRAALRAYRSYRYDLVLVDCRMPTMDGFAAVKAIRRFERKRNAARTPIVAITVDLDEGVRDRCRRSGMTACLSKPLNLKALAHVLDPSSSTTRVS